MSRHVSVVGDVHLVILKMNPPTLVVSALGAVPTGGWTKGRLEPRYYVEFPSDGIQDFDFVADPPEGMATMVITPITGSVQWPGYPQALRGVRVHSASNAIEAMLSTGKSVKLGG